MTHRSTQWRPDVEPRSARKRRCQRDVYAMQRPGKVDQV